MRFSQSILPCTTTWLLGTRICCPSLVWAYCRIVVPGCAAAAFVMVRVCSPCTPSVPLLASWMAPPCVMATRRYKEAQCKQFSLSMCTMTDVQSVIRLKPTVLATAGLINGGWHGNCSDGRCSVLLRFLLFDSRYSWGVQRQVVQDLPVCQERANATSASEHTTLRCVDNSSAAVLPHTCKKDVWRGSLCASESPSRCPRTPVSPRSLRL